MMRIVRFLTEEGFVSHGVLRGDENQTVIPIRGDVFGQWEEASDRLRLEQVQLLAPVQPPNIIAIGLNYRSHAEETRSPIPKAPIIFLKATSSLAGPGEKIRLPAMAPNEVDYEAELAVIIGRPARRVSEEDALDYVLGYTCGNDVSARDCQVRQDAQWARGKSFDTFAPLGPWIETNLDPDACDIRCRLNGETLQESNTSDLIFHTRHLISYLSHCMTLLPGTVIMTGTPGGVGFTRQPAIFLRPGDRVEVEIAGIGTLMNSVIAEREK